MVGGGGLETYLFSMVSMTGGGLQFEILLPNVILHTRELKSSFLFIRMAPIFFISTTKQYTIYISIYQGDQNFLFSFYYVYLFIFFYCKTFDYAQDIRFQHAIFELKIYIKQKCFFIFNIFFITVLITN